MDKAIDSICDMSYILKKLNDDSNKIRYDLDMITNKMDKIYLSKKSPKKRSNSRSSKKGPKKGPKPSPKPRSMNKKSKTRSRSKSQNRKKSNRKK